MERAAQNVPEQGHDAERTSGGEEGIRLSEVLKASFCAMSERKPNESLRMAVRLQVLLRGFPCCSTCGRGRLWSSLAGVRATPDKAFSYAVVGILFEVQVGVFRLACAWLLVGFGLVFV